MTLSEKIRKYRRDNGMGIEEFARKANLSSSTVSLFENNNPNVSLKSIKKIARVANIPMLEVAMSIC